MHVKSPIYLLTVGIFLFSALAACDKWPQVPQLRALPAAPEMTTGPAQSAEPVATTGPVMKIDEAAALEMLEQDLKKIAIRPPAGMPSDPDIAKLLDEVAALRNDLRQFRASMELYLSASESNARQERTLLLAQIQRLASQPQNPGAQDAGYLPPPPGPESVPAPAAASEAGAASPNAPVALASLDGVSYAVVKEWGVAPTKTNKDSSLRGLICAVPGSIEPDLLSRFGQSLARASADYGTVNIDVFDAVDAARQYANQGVDIPMRRVMRILKTPDTRLRILLNRNGEVSELPLEAAPAVSTGEGQ